MKQVFKSILCIATAFLFVATIQAQTYNAKAQTAALSVYVEGGTSGYYGVRSALFDNSKMSIAPDFDLGAKFNVKPWMRVGLNVGYTMMKSTNKTITSSTITDNDFMVGGHATTLETKIDCLQNRNDAHLLGVDINADFNILNLWPNRNTKWINLYAGVGVGYMHGWNRNLQTNSYSESAIAKGEGYYNVYNHMYLKSFSDNAQFNTLYVPVSLSIEFDVFSQFTICAIVQSKSLPINVELTPKGIFNSGIVVRYNL